MATKTSRYTTFLQNARRFFLVLGTVYILLVALGTVPFVQRQ